MNFRECARDVTLLGRVMASGCIDGGTGSQFETFLAENAGYLSFPP